MKIAAQALAEQLILSGEMLTAERPFAADSLGEVLRMQLQDEPPQPSMATGLAEGERVSLVPPRLNRQEADDQAKPAGPTKPPAKPAPQGEPAKTAKAGATAS